MADVEGSLTVTCVDTVERDAALQYFTMLVSEPNSEVSSVTYDGLVITVPLQYPPWNPEVAV